MSQLRIKSPVCRQFVHVNLISKSCGVLQELFSDNPATEIFSFSDKLNELDGPHLGPGYPDGGNATYALRF